MADISTTTPTLRELDEARLKYRAERDVRIRPEGEDQYLEVKGDFASFADDPFVHHPLTRDPIERHHDVIIVGAGFAGLVAAARLSEAGIRDVAIIDEASDVGGAWYWNRYPNAQCDIESYCYLPLLEETGFVPEHKYSYQPEIMGHAQRIAKHYDLYENAIFQTAVTRMEWDETASRWRLSTDRDDTLSAQFIILALGPGSKPKLPRVPGLDEYRGRIFHTSRWDYDYTGGSTAGGLTKLADKRVGFVGTGSTGVGTLPSIAEDAGELVLFQRTPPMVLGRDQIETDTEWAESLTPGWQVERRLNLEDSLLGRTVEVDMIADSWTEYYRRLRPTAVSGPECEELDTATRTELADLSLLKDLRAKVEQTVTDPETAEILKPWYRARCKRPTFSDTYLEMFNRPNVTVVDVSRTQGIERFTPDGVMVDGVEYPLDCVILSTGFEWGSSLDRRMNIPVVGRGGLELHDHWREGMQTLHGHSTSGFPNWFYTGRTQAAVSVNYMATIEGQVQNILYVISEVRRRGAAWAEATDEGQTGWLDEIARVTTDNSALLEECTPGYMNNEGQKVGRRSRFSMDRYSPGVQAFEELTAEWRADGNLEGMRIGGTAATDAG